MKVVEVIASRVGEHHLVDALVVLTKNGKLMEGYRIDVGKWEWKEIPVE